MTTAVLARFKQPSVLPGFGLSFGVAVTALSLVVTAAAGYAPKKALDKVVTGPKSGPTETPPASDARPAR